MPSEYTVGPQMSSPEAFRSKAPSSAEAERFPDDRGFSDVGNFADATSEKEDVKTVFLCAQDPVNVLICSGFERRCKQSGPKRR